MNNEVNDNIETLDVDEPVQIGKLDNTGLMDIINQNKINSENIEKPETNYPINPNAYHPSLNNNQNQVQNNPEPVNNVPVDPGATVQNEVEQHESGEVVVKKRLSIDKSAIIVLLVTLLSHFLIVPHVIIRLYVNTLGDVFADQAFKAILVSQSSVGFYFWLYLLVVPILTLLIASFSVVIFAVINVFKKGELTLELIPFIKKALLYSFFASVALLMIMQFLHTDFITPVLKITTFNGYSLSMFESLWQ